MKYGVIQFMLQSLSTVVNNISTKISVGDIFKDKRLLKSFKILSFSYDRDKDYEFTIHTDGKDYESNYYFKMVEDGDIIKIKV